MEVIIKHQEQRRFTVKSGEHEFILDLPSAKGGTDKGMGPTQAFLGSLGACVAVYAQVYCSNAKIPAEGFTIKINAQLSDEKPVRFSHIDIKIDLGIDLKDRAQAFLNFVKNCPIHNTVATHPEIAISVA
ncbi:OsmC family protein [Candidatus Omnitrophota bacterium]